MEDYLRVEDFEGLADFCEQAELESSSGVVSPEIYCCLLGVYLLKNELEHAKLLWARIPASHKENEDLTCLWDIGKKLWNGQFIEIYGIISSHTWPPHLSGLMTALKASLQTRLLNLIARSYTVVKVQSVLDMTGLTLDQLQLEVSTRKWQFDEAMNTIIINQSVVAEEDTTTPQKMLGQLARAVSFLEC